MNEPRLRLIRYHPRMTLATTIDHHHDASTATGIPNEKLFMIAGWLLKSNRTAKADRPCHAHRQLLL